MLRIQIVGAMASHLVRLPHPGCLRHPWRSQSQTVACAGARALSSASVAPSSASRAHVSIACGAETSSLAHAQRNQLHHSGLLHAPREVAHTSSRLRRGIASQSMQHSERIAQPLSSPFLHAPLAPRISRPWSPSSTLPWRWRPCAAAQLHTERAVDEAPPEEYDIPGLLYLHFCAKQAHFALGHAFALRTNSFSLKTGPLPFCLHSLALGKLL